MGFLFNCASIGVPNLISQFLCIISPFIEMIKIQPKSLGVSATERKELYLKNNFKEICT